MNTHMALLVALSLACGAVTTAARPRAVTLQATDAIKKDTSFHVEATHDGVDTDSYALYLNAALHASVPVSALANGIVAFPRFVNGLPKGTYQIVVRATGPGGFAESAPLTLTVTPGNPSAPALPRIIKGLD